MRIKKFALQYKDYQIKLSITKDGYDTNKLKNIEKDLTITFSATESNNWKHFGHTQQSNFKFATVFIKKWNNDNPCSYIFCPTKTENFLSKTKLIE